MFPHASTPSLEDEALAAKVRAFVLEKVIPYEKDSRNGAHGPTDSLRRELNTLAREAGILSPHVSREYGGLALTHQQRAMVFEAAGYSPLGPIALHCAAPDEGNMHLLEKVASEVQKERFLRPLAQAEQRSCFAMTEPPPGAGSDPSLLATTAEGDGQRFVVNGRKWLITGAPHAGFMILMARTLIRGEDRGATMFMVSLPNPAVHITRLLDSLDSSFTEGHAEVAIENLEVTANDVLGEIGQGFRYAQVRLAPARLTHCMRWLGAAERAQDIAKAHARTRQAFGSAIGHHEGVSYQISDNDMDLHMSRLVTRHAAWTLDQGDSGGFVSSRAKVMVSEAVYRVADRCVQILGGLGLTADTIVVQIFREVRAFRIYDGPSEVHRWSMGRKLLRADKQEKA